MRRVEPFYEVSHFVREAFRAGPCEHDRVIGAGMNLAWAAPVLALRLAGQRCVPPQDSGFVNVVAEIPDGAYEAPEGGVVCLLFLADLLFYNFFVQLLTVNGVCRDDVAHDGLGFERVVVEHFRYTQKSPLFEADLAELVDDGLGIEPETGPVGELVDVQHVINITFSTQKVRYMRCRIFLCRGVHFFS